MNLGLMNTYVPLIIEVDWVEVGSSKYSRLSTKVDCVSVEHKVEASWDWMGSSPAGGGDETSSGSKGMYCALKTENEVSSMPALERRYVT